MSGQPWFKFYPSDWLASVGDLTPTETGIFITLIAKMYEGDGELNRDDTKLSRLCGIPEAAFKKALEGLIDQGMIIENGSTLRCKPNLWKVRQRSLTNSTKAKIHERDGAQCRYCGATIGPFEIDHVYPWSLGGGDDPENLVVACRECNRAKGDKTLPELGWLQ